MAKAALANILSSQTFSDMPRLKRFLEYVVTETLAGNGDRLKGVVIACDVFDKTDPDEAQSTTIVRVEAGRMRRRLNDYYQHEGKDEPIRIRIPKGGYVVVFEPVPNDIAGSTDSSDKAGTNIKWFSSGSVLLAIATLACLVSIYIFWNRNSIETETGSQVQFPTLHDSNPLIAVLPFRDLVNGDADGTIAYGLTEDIIIDLSELSSLQVISLTSVLPFRNRDINPLDVSAKFSAHYVLSGSVRGTPPDLRVTAQLYDAVNGVQLWARRFDRQMTNELVLQRELARQVVDSLSIEFQSDEDFLSIKRRNTDPETWSLYKQAMNLVNPPSDPARLELSLQVFKQITEKDPNFAGGFAGVAYVHAFKVFFGHSQSIDHDVQVALDMAETAKNLDPSFSLNYSAQAFALLVNRDFDKALEASEKSITLTPNDPYMLAYHGFTLSASGESEKGLPYIETAIKLDPLNVRTPYLNILGVVSFHAGLYENALSAFLRNQDRGGPRAPDIDHFVAATYAELGDNEKAVAILRSAGLLENANHDWEAWVKRSWRNPEDSDHILKVIQQIRQTSE